MTKWWGKDHKMITRNLNLFYKDCRWMICQDLSYFLWTDWYAPQWLLISNCHTFFSELALLSRLGATGGMLACLFKDGDCGGGGGGGGGAAPPWLLTLGWSSWLLMLLLLLRVDLRILDKSPLVISLAEEIQHLCVCLTPDFPLIIVKSRFYF